MTRAAAAAPAVAPQTAAGELGALARVAGPLAVAYIAEMAISFTDTIVVGRLGSVPLAAVGVTANLFFSLLLVCMAAVSAVSVLAAEALAKNDDAAAANAVRQGFWLSVALALPAFAMAWFMGPILSLLGQDAAILPYAEAYVRAVVWGFLPYLWFTVLRSFATATGFTWPVLVVTVGSVPLNLAANYLLVFGHLGLPAMGVAGSGWASTIVCWCMLAALTIHALRSPSIRRFDLFRHLLRIDGRMLRRLLQLGLPAGGLTAAETGFFTASALLMGLFGAAVLAANQIAIMFLSIMFMVPAAISHAAAARVAYGLGLGDAHAARRAGLVAMGAGVVYMLLSAAVVLAMPATIARLFLDSDMAGNAEVIALAVQLLFIAALYQVADGLQVVSAGSLRGLKDATVPLLIGLGGYWAVGLGTGALLAFTIGWGPTGIWWGMALGLSVTAALLSLRFHRVSRALAAVR
ncbi:MAG: MATE family efflux transporter [Pseudomonadota bacterium]